MSTNAFHIEYNTGFTGFSNWLDLRKLGDDNIFGNSTYPDFATAQAQLLQRSKENDPNVKNYRIVCGTTVVTQPVVNGTFSTLTKVKRSDVDADADGGRYVSPQPTWSRVASPTPGANTPGDTLKDVKDANPKQAFGDLKVPLHLVPYAIDHYVAVGLGEGADKYGAWNWRSSKVEAMTYIAAIKRHLAAWIDGEELDPDSATDKHHLAGAAASLAILLDAKEGGFLIDNRPPPGPAPALVRKPVKRVKKVAK